MNRSLFLCVLFAVIALSVGKPNPCDKGPDYWCENEEKAARCGVLEFCKLKYPGKMRLETPKAYKTAAPVKVELYYESLCPGCRAFIMGQLFPTFQKLAASEIIDIGLYPYGNARETQVGQSWRFDCQHGEEECTLNLVETCALHLLVHQNRFMPYIHCLESSPSMENAKSCASQFKIEWGPIGSCFNGTQGNHLEHEMAMKTNALNPPHQYVPWIVVNGVHTDAIQESAQSDLMHLVCQTYTGVQPHACRIHAQPPKPTKCYKN